MEIEKPTIGKSKLVSTVGAIIIAGILFGSIGYLLGGRNNNADKPKNQIVKDEGKNQDKKIEEEEIDNEEKGGIENIEDEMADWQTYTNDKYGFEANYPKDYSISTGTPTELPSVINAKKNIKIEVLYQITFIGNENVEVTIHDNRNDYTLEQWLEEYREISPVNVGLSFGVSSDKQKEITIDGIKGLKGDFGCCMNYQHSVFLKNGDKIYQISGSILDFTTRIYPNEEIFDQILSTFKFTGTDEAADWKTYTNNEYGYEMTLLDSWKGYSTLTKIWNGTTLDGKSTKYQGPEIIIRNPKWSTAQPWQDIPVMVFTKEEWELIEAKNLNVNAAPVGPEKLDENQKYVFALPPRWVGFADVLGQNEAQEIAKTIKAISF